MNAPLTIAPGWDVPPEVLAFAQESGVSPYLPGMLEAARRVFSTARRHEVVVEDDPEIANDRHIVIEVDLPMTVDEARAARQAWHDETIQVCPTPLICTFRLHMHLVD